MTDLSTRLRAAGQDEATAATALIYARNKVLAIIEKETGE